ncbi:hypothetical protein [Streptomyces sp. NBC_01276]|uniref:hypothetical protein n=1 Tax=Streptomyces sp. NBC_01276 TaxID=2903808 RepID=UPI00352EE8FB
MHKNLRHGVIAAAVIAAALALTACGSDSGGDSGKGKATVAKDPKPASTPSSTAGGPDSAPTTGSDAKIGSVEGSWLSAATPSKPVVVTVKGKIAVVVEGSTGLTCQGTTDGKAFDLKCPAGALHAKGTILSADAAGLKVTWTEVGTETYQKTDPGKLPTGLPGTLPKS